MDNRYDQVLYGGGLACNGLCEDWDQRCDGNSNNHGTSLFLAMADDHDQGGYDGEERREAMSTITTLSS
ncbi:hypothetical protein EV182_000965, partial [Spiromyces aspiralis]